MKFINLNNVKTSSLLWIRLPQLDLTFPLLTVKGNTNAPVNIMITEYKGKHFHHKLQQRTFHCGIFL